MIGSTWKKLACVGLIACAAVFSGCGNSSKVAVVDYQKIENESPKVKDIQKQITDKDTEIQNRLNQEAQSGLSDEEMQKKVQAAQQERMIFVQSKQKKLESLIQAQCGAIAKEKNIGIVMYQRAVPVGAVDITDEVLKRMDGSSKAGSASK